MIGLLCFIFRFFFAFYVRFWPFSCRFCPVFRLHSLFPRLNCSEIPVHGLFEPIGR